MKDIFKGYYQLDQGNFTALWQNATFIFDTNVLLNLYRYQSNTRDSLLKVMEDLSDRVWIPYHVGLEYQRNRLDVIADQRKRFSDVRNIVTDTSKNMSNRFSELQLKKRHSFIDPDTLLKRLSELECDFLKELDDLEAQSPTVHADDEIRNRIDGLFSGKIGSPPKNQKEIDVISNSGKTRFKHKVPPGFKDSGKNNNETNSDFFSFSGIVYERKYGDLIVWNQIIDHAKDNELKNIIFVTDDAKSDWWLKINSGGLKTISVRPELVDEIHRLSGVERFHAYNTENFLKHANEYRHAHVTPEAIDEVREVLSQKYKETSKEKYKGSIKGGDKDEKFEIFMDSFSEESLLHLVEDWLNSQSEVKDVEPHEHHLGFNYFHRDLYTTLDILPIETHFDLEKIKGHLKTSSILKQAGHYKKVIAMLVAENEVTVGDVFLALGDPSDLDEEIVVLVARTAYEGGRIIKKKLRVYGYHGKL